MASDDEDYGELDDFALLAASENLEQGHDVLPEANISFTTPDQALHNDDDLLNNIFTSDLAIDFENEEQVPSNNRPVRQQDLFGNVVGGAEAPVTTTRSWRLTNHQEAPTHHKLDLDAAKTWIYPSNLAHRDYQFNIVKRALFSNVLVALPTGLGKTFIAATVMLNWYRWTPESQIIFMAPTKPLVSQQVDACHTIAGIPRSQTCQLTGNISPAIRADYWQQKRVFFMTPQTLETDLTSGRCDAKRISLIVVDEAHRATGAYAYVKVIQFIRRFNKSFRVMALTATPGSKVETVQEVITSLGIARTEIRTEESLDIKEYIQARNIEVEKFDLSDEIVMLRDLFSDVLRPSLRKLNEMKAFYVTDPSALTAFQLNDGRGKWMNSMAGRTANMGLKQMVVRHFTILAQLAYAFELLLYHGVKPFYDYVYRFYQDAISKPKEGGKIMSSIVKNEKFTKILSRCKAFVNSPEFSGHPKLDFLVSTILRHFSEAAERGEDDSKVMVFSNYRNSGEEIFRVLKAHAPIIKPQLFIGQSAGKTGEGMSQKEQQAVVENFKKNIFNVLVATSIGEEGLDIGEVDFIVCYDASASPIRMLQRMGRTGRKRAGGVLVLVTEGKEWKKWEKANDNYRWIQNKITSGKEFQYEEDLSPRIIPSDIEPICEKKHISPPIENTQPSPPRRNQGKTRKKAPPRKFHMPDGVETGFTTAARFGGFTAAKSSNLKGAFSDLEDDEDNISEEINEEIDYLVLPPEAGLLTAKQEADLNRRYRTIYGDEERLIIEPPRLDAFPFHQTRLSTTHFVKHGRATKAMVNMMRKIAVIDDQYVAKLKATLRDEDKNFTRNPLILSSSPRPASSPPFQVVVTKRFVSDAEAVERTAPSQLSSLVERSTSSRNTPVATKNSMSFSVDDKRSRHSSFIDLSSQQTTKDPSPTPPPSSVDLLLPKQMRSDSEESEELPSASQLISGWGSSFSGMPTGTSFKQTSPERNKENQAIGATMKRKSINDSGDPVRITKTRKRTVLDSDKEFD